MDDVMQIPKNSHVLTAVCSSLLVLVLAGCNDIEAPNLTQPDQTNNAHNAKNPTPPKPCDGACSDTTSHCDETTNTCVACLENSHCPSDPLTNFTGFCTANKCETSSTICADGYVDLDNNSDNGCECQISDENDIPDIDGTDSNCDGFDGITGKDGNVIFVRPGGDMRNDGFTPDKPLPSIAAALSAAADSNRPYILVAAGDYNESITLKNGISIFGGYHPTTWKRQITTNQTFIKGDGKPDARTKMQEADLLGHYKTVKAYEIKDKTILSGLTIVGQDAEPTNKTASTFALWSENSQNLHIHDSLIIGGRASNGKNGNNGRDGDHPDLQCVPASGGKGGEAGSREQDTAIFPCNLMSIGYANHGEPGETAINGAGSNNPVSKNGGMHTCGPTVDQTHGGPGDPGQPGASGLNSQPRDNNYLGGIVFHENYSTWLHVPHKQSASNGIGGNGGQGGGAAGNQSLSGDESHGTFLGVAGGDGGHGGCGGEAGNDGFAGGSSFGVLVLKGQVSFQNTVIQLGTGGSGGLAGTAGTGSLGQPGKSAPSPPKEEIDLPQGGNGGKGGNGGDGGKALPGFGGHAVGLAYLEESNVLNTDQIIYITDHASPGKGQEGWEPNQKRDGQILKSHKFPEHD